MASGENIYIGLGSNLGDRLKQIRFGITSLQALAVSGRIEVSPLYESEPWGGVEQGSFINGVAMFETELEPAALLMELKRIETEVGRESGGIRWGARELDLDILLYGERRVESSELTIPHPYLTSRRFVLTPLNDLSPDTIIPGHNVKVAEALRIVNDPSRIKPYSEGISL